MGPFSREFRIVATAAFATGPRAAAATYLMLTVALGAYAVLYGGAGPDDLFPGAVFLLVTAPVSVPAFMLLPASWINTRAFGWALVPLGPIGTLAIMAAFWSGWRRLTAFRRRASGADDPC